MKTGFLLGRALMLFVSLSLFVSCKNDGGDARISLNETELNMNIGETAQLTVSPSGKTITWESSDLTVATVVNGLVTAIDNGTATITARFGNQEATCLVNVAEVFITLDETEVDLWVGFTKQLTATVIPEGIAVRWESSDEGVATVDETGLVTGVAIGTATISAVIGSTSADCIFDVKEPEITVWTLGNYSTATNTPKPQYVRIYKNEEIFVELTDASANSIGTDMVVDGDYLYVCGSEGKPFVGMVWKVNINTKAITKTELTDGTYNTYPLSIFVANGKVYVAGYEANPSASYQAARLWIDGAKQPDFEISGSSLATPANSVFVDGTDVYVGGQDGTVGVIWKNGVRTVVQEPVAGANPIINGVAVADGVVYAVGTFGANNARIWTNGVMTTLPSPLNGGTPNGVIISDGDVYVVGAVVINNDIPTLLRRSGGVWKNGEHLYTLWNGVSTGGVAQGIAVMDGDVYATGYETRTRGQLMVWKNGEELWQLSHIESSPFSMTGNAIAVTKK